MITNAKRGMFWAGLLAATIALTGWTRAGDGLLKSGAKLAVVGDSITEQKQYSKFIELYLTVCEPELKVKVAQFGWGGETAAGFSRRMDNDLAWFKPDVVTLCYGMNDGRYTAFTKQIGEGYEKPLADIVARLKKAGAKVVVGSPGAVDTKYYRKNPPAEYNDNLAHLRDIAKQVAEANGETFANVHDPLIEAMAKAKAALGDDYDVCGRDGVHPQANGHLVMAQAFLKALGCKGEIGTITVKGDEATVTAGHRVISSKGGVIELESTRYPFCFGDAKSPLRSILPYSTFNQDLNRFILKVEAYPAPKAKVTWGNVSQVFTSAQLAEGVNLAAEFAPTPFDPACAAVERQVAGKQNFETMMVKQIVTSMPSVTGQLKDDLEATELMQKLVAKLVAKQEKLTEAAAAEVKPVKHTLKIEKE